MNNWKNVDIGTLESVFSYVNENRLINVLSKLTEKEKENNSKIIGLFIQDIIKDFTKDYGLDDKNKKSAANYVRRDVVKTYNEYKMKSSNHSF